MLIDPVSFYKIEQQSTRKNFQFSSVNTEFYSSLVSIRHESCTTIRNTYSKPWLKFVIIEEWRLKVGYSGK